MKHSKPKSVVFFLALVWASTLGALAGSGRLEGSITGTDARPIPGVEVAIVGTRSTVLTANDGSFEFKNVRPGTYSVTFGFLEYKVYREDVVVEAGSTTRVDQVVDWDVAFVETVTVYSASRRRERIVDAPAAVTVITQDEIERQASYTQVPKLFEFTPGVDITQINAVEFLVNTRGFNSGLNRRVAVLVDGRDMSDPFVGATEWPTLSFPLDDLAELELVRGPSSALYGANATGGVINVSTKQPRDSLGGQVRLSAGDADSSNLDFRWAGGLGSDWYIKVVGGLRRTDGFSVSRQFETEYSVPCPDAPDCLPLDSIPLQRSNIDINFGGLRLDKHLANGSVFTIEAGTTEYDGPIFLTNVVARGQILDVKKPWARFNYSTEHWNVLAFHNKRDAEALDLNLPPPNFELDADNSKIEVQTNWNFVDNKVRLVAGASHFDENVDSTALLAPFDNTEQALFGQVDWQVNDHLKLVGAARWDDGDLYDAQFSPKAAVVYSVNPEHTLRFNYNKGFQVPTYAELLLYFDLGFTTDLSAENQICIDFAGVDCGLDSTQVAILGNRELPVEEVRTLELGYKAIIARKAYLTLDLYDSRNENFVTPLLPQINPPPVGQTNESFGPWVGPVEAETTPIAPVDCSVTVAPGSSVADCVRASAAETLAPGGTGSQLGNLADGESVVLPLSLKTIGEVDTRGADVGVGYYFAENWKALLSYSWFDFEIVNAAPGLEGVVLPNAPEHKASLGFFYAKKRWDASLKGRWVDEFRWANPAFQGNVDSFITVDLLGNYAFNDHWRVGLNAVNIFDDEHWEAFGGDLLGRRLLGFVGYSW